MDHLFHKNILQEKHNLEWQLAEANKKIEQLQRTISSLQEKKQTIPTQPGDIAPSHPPISESESPTLRSLRGLLAAYLPYPDSGGRNVVPAGSIPSPKRPVPTSVRKRELYSWDGELRQLPTDDYPDTQEPPPGVLRQWPDENTSQIPV